MFQTGSAVSDSKPTPVETKADPTQLFNISSQIAQLTATVNQLTQVVVGQTFTRAAPQGVAIDTLNTADELRSLANGSTTLRRVFPEPKKRQKSNLFQ